MRWSTLFAVGVFSSCGGANEPDGTPLPMDTASTDGVCQGLTVRSFQDGGSTTAPFLQELAADFTVNTRDGDWTLSENHTGCDIVLFTRATPPTATGPWTWDGDDHKDLLKALPANVHLFFVPDEGTRAGDRMQLDVIEEKMDAAVRSLGSERRALWEGTGRIHYVKDGVSELGNWVGELLESPGFGVGIDRFQRVRYLGSYADGDRFNGSWFDDNLAHLAHEPIYFNFESDRQDQLDAEQDVMIIETWNGEIVADPNWAGVRGSLDVTMPDAASMVDFDSLTVDMNMTCGGEGDFGFCPAWDRITDLFLCDTATEAANPYASQACQPFVPEGLGTCLFDGEPSKKDTCRADDDCDEKGTSTGTVVCDGFVPAVAADTAPCDCADVMGAPYEADRRCGADGTGFGECNCSCNTLVNRWITTYHREGRWTNDAHHALAWFRRGGDFTFEYYSVDGWEIDIDLRFHNQGLSEKVEQATPLFRGGTFGPSYNDAYSPIVVDIPADATKVELAVVVSGHGQADPGNCAEFCNTAHHFGVNGMENLIDFPYLDDPALTGEFCQNDVANGTVPNQYGTWFFARSNWCPGKEVAPIYIDVTSQVTPGEGNTFTYFGDWEGGSHPGGAYMALDSFVVVHR